MTLLKVRSGSECEKSKISHDERDGTLERLGKVAGKRCYASSVKR